MEAFMDRVNKIMPYAFPFILLGLGLTFYFVNPSSSTHPVHCILRTITGFQCPACGMQRALHAMAHGHFAEALSYNYMFVLAVPYALMAVLATWYNVRHVFDGLQRIVYHRYTLKGYVIIILFWWVARNVLGI